MFDWKFAQRASIALWDAKTFNLLPCRVFGPLFAAVAATFQGSDLLSSAVLLSVSCILAHNPVHQFPVGVLWSPFQPPVCAAAPQIPNNMQGVSVPPHTPGASWTPGRASQSRCPKPFSSTTTTRWMARHAPAHQPTQRHLTRATPPPREDQEVSQPPSRDGDSKQQGATDSSSQGGGVSRLVAAVAILAAAAAAAGLKDKVHDLEDLITASGYLGPVIYAGAYTTATVLLFPASVLTLAAGYLFGECAPWCTFGAEEGGPGRAQGAAAGQPLMGRVQNGRLRAQETRGCHTLIVPPWLLS